jgi:hypothetical protein
MLRFTESEIASEVANTTDSRMKNSLSTLIVAGVVAATIAVGVLHGKMTLRWGVSPDITAAAEKLRALPEVCGDWRMETSRGLSDSARKMLRCYGDITRRYVNQKTGEAVLVGIVFGPAGPIAEHTPEVCVGSRNYSQLGKRKRVGVSRAERASGESPEDTLWYVDFEKNGPSREKMRIYWAWSTGGAWTAPDSPKRTFAGLPFLYKIQISTTSWAGTSGENGEAPDDSIGRFIKEFAGIVERHMATADAGSGRK